MLAGYRGGASRALVPDVAAALIKADIQEIEQDLTQQPEYNDIYRRVYTLLERQTANKKNKLKLLPRDAQALTYRLLKQRQYFINKPAPAAPPPEDNDPNRPYYGRCARVISEDNHAGDWIDILETNTESVQYLNAASRLSSRLTSLLEKTDAGCLGDYVPAFYVHHFTLLNPPQAQPPPDLPMPNAPGFIYKYVNYEKETKFRFVEIHTENNQTSLRWWDLGNWQSPNIALRLKLTVEAGAGGAQTQHTEKTQFGSLRPAFYDNVGAGRDEPKHHITAYFHAPTVPLRLFENTFSFEDTQEWYNIDLWMQATFGNVTTFALPAHLDNQDLLLRIFSVGRLDLATPQLQMEQTPSGQHLETVNVNFLEIRTTREILQELVTLKNDIQVSQEPRHGNQKLENWDPTRLAYHLSAPPCDFLFVLRSYCVPNKDARLFLADTNLMPNPPLFFAFKDPAVDGQIAKHHYLAVLNDGPISVIKHALPNPSQNLAEWIDSIVTNDKFKATLLQCRAAILPVDRTTGLLIHSTAPTLRSAALNQWTIPNAVWYTYDNEHPAYVLERLNVCRDLKVEAATALILPAPNGIVDVFTAANGAAAFEIIGKWTQPALQTGPWTRKVQGQLASTQVDVAAAAWQENRPPLRMWVVGGEGLADDQVEQTADGIYVRTALPNPAAQNYVVPPNQATQDRKKSRVQRLKYAPVPVLSDVASQGAQDIRDQVLQKQETLTVEQGDAEDLQTALAQVRDAAEYLVVTSTAGNLLRPYTEGRLKQIYDEYAQFRGNLRRLQGRNENTAARLKEVHTHAKHFEFPDDLNHLQRDVADLLMNWRAAYNAALNAFYKDNNPPPTFNRRLMSNVDRMLGSLEASRMILDLQRFANLPEDVRSAFIESIPSQQTRVFLDDVSSSENATLCMQQFLTGGAAVAAHSQGLQQQLTRANQLNADLQQELQQVQERVNQLEQQEQVGNQDDLEEQRPVVRSYGNIVASQDLQVENAQARLWQALWGVYARDTLVDLLTSPNVFPVPDNWEQLFRTQPQLLEESSRQYQVTQNVQLNWAYRGNMDYATFARSCNGNYFWNPFMIPNTSTKQPRSGSSWPAIYFNIQQGHNDDLMGPHVIVATDRATNAVLGFIEFDVYSAEDLQNAGDVYPEKPELARNKNGRWLEITFVCTNPEVGTFRDDATRRIMKVRSPPRQQPGNAYYLLTAPQNGENPFRNTFELHEDASDPIIPAKSVKPPKGLGRMLILSAIYYGMHAGIENLYLDVARSEFPIGTLGRTQAKTHDANMYTNPAYFPTDLADKKALAASPRDQPPKTTTVRGYPTISSRLASYFHHLFRFDIAFDYKSMDIDGSLGYFMYLPKSQATLPGTSAFMYRDMPNEEEFKTLLGALFASTPDTYAPQP